jgi:hypothetical protein
MTSKFLSAFHTHREYNLGGNEGNDFGDRIRRYNIETNLKKRE